MPMQKHLHRFRPLTKLLDDNRTKVYLRAGDTVLRIPERIGGATVTRIEDRAFQYIGGIFPGLTDIIMPDTVETVGIAAFQNVNGGYVQQTNVKIRLSQNLKAIQAYAFYQAERAISDEFGIIQLPDSLEFLGYNVFQNGYCSTVTGRSWNYLIRMPKTPVYIDQNCCQTDAAVADHSTLEDIIVAYDDPVLFFGQDMLDRMESQMTPEERQVLLDSYEENGKRYSAFAESGLYDTKKQGVDAKNLYGGFQGGAFLYDECEIVSAEHPKTLYSGTPTLYLPDWIFKQESLTIEASGDIDCNGECNIADAILLARYIAEDNDISITEDGITAADLDADGYVTAMDQNKLLELIAHADF